MRESTTLPLCRAAHGHSRTPIEGVLQQSPEVLAAAPHNPSTFTRPYDPEQGINKAPRRIQATEKIPKGLIFLCFSLLGRQDKHHIFTVELGGRLYLRDMGQSLRKTL